MSYAFTDDSDETLIDAWHEGYFAARNGNSLPYDPGPLADAWKAGKREAIRESRVQVVMPARAEGYYHVNPNGEDY